MKYTSRPKNAAVKHVDIADILGQKYRYWPTSKLDQLSMVITHIYGKQ